MFHKNIKILLLLVLASGYVSSLYASDKIEADNKSLKNDATTTGFLQEITETRIHKGPNRSGKEVFEFRCNGCHGRNTQGAPMPDDNFEWSMRLRQKGLDLMLKHSMEGFNNDLMPAKGGCRDCNQEEVYAALFYMLERSGINTEELRKKIK
jgi:cytochrome c5